MRFIRNILDPEASKCNSKSHPRFVTLRQAPDDEIIPYPDDGADARRTADADLDMLDPGAQKWNGPDYYDGALS